MTDQAIPRMSDTALADRLNEEGRRQQEEGALEAAEASYRAAMAADPEWSAPAYNLGLLHKYSLEWKQSFEMNRLAASLDPTDQATWWNLGIAATALGEWGEARRAWA
jgi:tetratricopeptide (TPR) repeat protein